MHAVSPDKDIADLSVIRRLIGPMLCKGDRIREFGWRACDVGDCCCGGWADPAWALNASSWIFFPFGSLFTRFWRCSRLATAAAAAIDSFVKWRWCIIAWSRSFSFCSWISSWKTTCIWILACAVVQSSILCSVFKCLDKVNRSRNLLFRVQKNSYFVNVCKSSKIMSHPGHLQAPRPYLEYCWWLATSEASAGFMWSAAKLPAKKLRFKSLRRRFGGCSAPADGWLAPVRRLFRFSDISSRRKLMIEFKNWLIQLEGLSPGFRSFCFIFGLSFRWPLMWFSLVDGVPSRCSFSLAKSSLSFDALSPWLVLLLVSFLKFTLSPLNSELPASNRCPFGSAEWILWLLSSLQYSLQCERSGNE